LYAHVRSLKLILARCPFQIAFPSTTTAFLTTADATTAADMHVLGGLSCAGHLLARERDAARKTKVLRHFAKLLANLEGKMRHT